MEIIKKCGFNSLTKEDVLNAKGDIISIKRTKPLTLASSIIQNKIKDIGNFEEEKTFKLSSNQLKYDITDTEHLNFEYLKEHSIKTEPVLFTSFEKQHVKTIKKIV